MKRFLVSIFLTLIMLIIPVVKPAMAVTSPLEAISGKDVIYFVLIDRWFDGDLENNQNDVNKDDPRAYHGGDFAGIIKKIPYLKDLGVTALWVTPVYRQIGEIDPNVNPCDPNTTSASYHGYWFSNPYRVDNHLYTKHPGENLEEGDLTYFKEFVDILHENQIKVILDMVFNHTGYHNDAYFAEVAANPDETIKDEWFNDPSLCGIPICGVAGSQIKCALAGLPDINHDLVDVRDFFIKNTEAWIETGIDGIRLDTTKHLEDALWNDLKQTIWSKYPDLTWIGEVLLYDVETLVSYQNDDGLDSVFDFAFYQAIIDTLINNQSMTLLASPFGNSNSLFDLDRLYRDPNLLSTVTDNHDLSARIMSIIQNVYGDTPQAEKVMKLIFGLQFTTRGIPKIYYGTEVGMVGGKDPDNRRDMQFPVKDLNTGEYDNDLINYLIKLVEIRKSSEDLQFGTLTTLYSDQFIYAFLRHYGNQESIVVINNGNEAMPESLSITIDGNANIPTRVKERLRDKILIDRLTGDEYQATGSFDIQLDGKDIIILQ